VAVREPACAGMAPGSAADRAARSSRAVPGTYPGRVPDPSGFDLAEIANALADQADYEHRWLINPGTGEIAFWTADTGIDGQTPTGLGELDLVVIDPLSSVWYQDMADFAGGITDERAGRRLARAIRRGGAFRRVRDELYEDCPDPPPAWQAFRDARAKRRAVQWPADNSARRPSTGPLPAVWHQPGGPRDVFSFGLLGPFADEAHRCAIPRSAGEIPCPLPQSLASSSVAVRPACVVRRRKSASSWSSASPYPAQIWSIEVFIPE